MPEQSTLSLNELRKLSPEDFAIKETLDAEKREKVRGLIAQFDLLDDGEISQVVNSLTVRETIELLEIMEVKRGVTSSFVVIEETQDGQSKVRRNKKDKKGTARYMVNMSSTKSGGMGSVLPAFDLLMARSSAIKLIPNGGDDEIQERLQTEAQVQANSQHPTVVDVYGFIRLDDATSSSDKLIGGGIVLEYMHPRKNPTVDDLMSAQKFSTGEEINGRNVFPPELVLQFVDDLTKAIEYLGEKRRKLTTASNGEIEGYSDPISHYDIKPANIFYTNKGFKLADFGLSDAVHDDDTSFGTPTFISVEKALGRGELVTSDLYSLGMNLFYLVTGTNAPVGRTPMEVSLDVVTGKHVKSLEGDPESGSADRRLRLLKQYCDQTGLHFEQVRAFFLKALAVDKSDRYQTIEEYRSAAFFVFHR